MSDQSLKMWLRKKIRHWCPSCEVLCQNHENCRFTGLPQKNNDYDNVEIKCNRCGFVQKFSID